MTQPTDRRKAFRAAIAGFIEARREAKLKDKQDDAEAAPKYDYASWLADAASRAHNLKVVTHPIKFTHSGIKGASSVHASAAEVPPYIEIGTHSVPAPEEDFAISDAKHLDIYSLFKEEVHGKRLLDWFREEDADLESALDNDPAIAAGLMASFRSVLRPNDKAISHPLAKQVYWLEGGDPADDCQYHLLQPMFSSTLEHAVHEDVRAVREATFAARGTRKQKPSFADHSTYPGLAARQLGGSNAQNISPQNKVRGGVNYLLASLPPAAWKPRDGESLLKLDSIFNEKRGPFFWFGDVRPLVRELADFLDTDPEANKETRERVKKLASKLGDQVALFGAAVRGRFKPGWTRGEDCQLVECEKLWLDQERSELPPRNDPDHVDWQARDIAFTTAYERGDWADEVATRFARWLNQQLRARSDKLIALGEAEMHYFTRKAILEVAWPIPLQRRATETTA